MVLNQPQFRRVFDDDDPLFFRNEPRYGPQKDCFSGARAAGNDDVLSQPHADIDEFLRRRAEAAEIDQVVDGEDLLGEAADSEVGPRPAPGNRSLA